MPWGGGVLSSLRTETRGRGAERCTRRQVLSLSKSTAPGTHLSVPVSCNLSIAFTTLSWSSRTQVLSLNTPLKYPEVSWTLISIRFSRSPELIRGSIQRRWKAARLSGGTRDGPPRCFLVPAPRRRVSHCSLAPHSLWLTFPSYASPSDRRFDSDFFVFLLPPFPAEGEEQFLEKKNALSPTLPKPSQGASGRREETLENIWLKAFGGFQMVNDRWGLKGVLFINDRLLREK